LHIDHEIVEYVAAEEPEYEETVKVYQEEIPVQEGAPEPLTTNFAAHHDAQGKPRLKGPCLVLVIE
jgi:inosine-uridine nucleoside N-ribohydrolase